MTKEQWIEMYAIKLMASYDALHYDDNCASGWKNIKCLPPDEAENLAEKAWYRKIVLEGQKM